MTKKVDLVVLGIGHSPSNTGAGISKTDIIKANCLEAAMKDSGWNGHGITEYGYNLGLANMIQDYLNKNPVGIIAVKSNRTDESGVEFTPKLIPPNLPHGNPSKPSGEVYVWEYAIPNFVITADAKLKEHGEDLLLYPRLFINLHFDAPGREAKENGKKIEIPVRTDSGFYFFNPAPDIFHYESTTKFLKCQIKELEAIGMKRNVKKWDLYTLDNGRRDNGYQYLNSPIYNTIKRFAPKKWRTAICLLELFNAYNYEDIAFAINNKQQIAEAIAKGIINYSDGNIPEYSATEIQRQTHFTSKDTINNKDAVHERFSNDEKKVLAVQVQKDLTEVESTLSGGTSITNHSGNSIEVIGTKPPPFSATRPVSSGSSYSVPMIRSGGIVKNQKAITTYENIDVTGRIPFGKKQIFANTLYEINSYELNLFSGETVRLRAGGTMEISCNTQISMTAAQNVVITAGNFMNLSAATILAEGDLNVNNNLTVSGNALVAGGMYISTGINSTSFNGPATIDKTNKQELYGYLIDNVCFSLKKGNTGLILGNPQGSINATFNGTSGQLILHGGGDILCDSNGDIRISSVNSGEGEGGKAALKIPPHLHYFKRLNGTLADSSVELQNNIAADYVS